MRDRLLGSLWITASLLTAVLSMAGCSTLGASALKGERVNLNVALQQTGDEQLLLNLVRLRYRDTPAFLELSSISSQSRFEASLEAGAELTRPKVDPDTDLIKLTGTTAYANQPTLTYTPLQGDSFIQRLLTPLSLEKLVLLYRSGWNARRVFRLCVQRLNNVKNAPRASGPTPEDAPEFKEYQRVLQLARDLERRNALDIVFETHPSAGTTPRLVLQIAPEALSLPETQELVKILQLAPGKTHYPFVSPAVQHMQAQDSDVLRVETRSLLGMLYYLSQGVEVPDRDRQKGKVTVTLGESGTTFDWQQVLGDSLRIKCQEIQPIEAAVAVRYRGSWFYIDDSDLESKSTFSMLSQIFALQAGKAEGITPVLTIPVGR
jgi:hypothetical protein